MNTLNTINTIQDAKNKNYSQPCMINIFTNLQELCNYREIMNECQKKINKLRDKYYNKWCNYSEINLVVVSFKECTKTNSWIIQIRKQN